MFEEFLYNFSHNLFKPLLLFFYAGFAIPLLKIKFEFPKVLYQGMTIYLLLAIGWHGGEELAGLNPQMLGRAAGFMLLGFFVNTLIGIFAYNLLRWTTRLRKVDAATVAGYYGSDSAGTFVTCIGVLTAAHISFAPYMPVMLAVMEIPGCLVALVLIARLRHAGMDAEGNVPGEPLFSLRRRPAAASAPAIAGERPTVELIEEEETVTVRAGRAVELVGAAAQGSSGNGVAVARRTSVARFTAPSGPAVAGNGDGHRAPHSHHVSKAERAEADMALETIEEDEEPILPRKSQSVFSKEMLHEVFLNPGIFLLFAGIVIGFVSRLQGESVTAADDALFVHLFQGILCLFLLEMGMTASQKLKDLKRGGWQFIAFGLLAPNLFATFGMLAAHGYSLFLRQPFEIGTYVLFAVLCGAASYIAVPAVQRIAIPEASPTLPLAASLGLTFSYNVTVGIPVYILIAKLITAFAPVYA